MKLVINQMYRERTIVIPALKVRHGGFVLWRTGIQSVNFFRKLFKTWIPAFAGMTTFGALVLIILISVSHFSYAASSDPVADFSARVHKFTLTNGLRVLIVERHASPTVSFAMFIRTGGIDDESGKSGMAHMFEHMLFKGTKTIGTNNFAKESKVLDQIDAVEIARQKETDPTKIAGLNDQLLQLNHEHEKYLVPEEFWKIYERAGGKDLNAATGYDYTNYVISLPSNQLPLWFTLEADRIKNPVLREFYKERDVVMEERRLRVDNSPSGKLWENFLAAAFMAHPYGRPILGWDSDISRVTRPDAEKFFNAHYDISRLVVAVVGDVDSTQMEKLFKQYFGSILPRALPKAARIPVEPAQAGERRIQVEYDSEPSLLIGYHRPDLNDSDEAVFEVLSDLLSSGRTGRFDREIVDKKKIATDTWASASGPGERDPNLFLIGGTPRNPHTTAELERALYDEIEKIKTNGPTDGELEKVKNNALASLLESIASNSGMANQLAYTEAVGGNWTNLISLLKKIQAVSSADVMRVANRYLVPSNRTVAELVKKNAK